MSLKKHPILLLLLPFIIGIYSVLNLSLVYQTAYLLLFGICFGCSIFLYWINKKKYKVQSEFSFTILVIIDIFLFGLCYCSTQWDHTSENHFSKINAEHLLVTIISNPIEKKNSIQAMIQAKAAFDFEDEMLDASGNAIVYLEKELSQLQYGDQLIIPNKLKEIPPPMNPYEFDYKAYLANKNLYYQAYFKLNNITQIDNNDLNLKQIVFRKTYQFRAFISYKIQSYFKDQSNIAVASALLLGDKQFVDKDLRSTYQDTGAMHILAVSGLHVGIIALLLQNILNFLNFLKYRKVIKSVSIITILWLFAALTGLTPSVTRAATMFSIIIIGNLLSRNNNIYNSIAASAFILLLYNPFWLLDIGFQLSYMALLGIVYLYPKLRDLYKPQNKLISKIWDINLVAIAAQVFTLPICLYNFQQFPLIFFISNPLAIVGASFILYLGISFIFLVTISEYFTFMAYLVEWNAYFLELIIQLLNFCLNYLQQLPFSTLKGLVFNDIQYYLLLFCIISMIVSIRNTIALKIRYLLLTFLCSSFLFSSYQLKQEIELVVFNYAGESLIGMREGHQQVLVSSSSNKEEINLKTNSYDKKKHIENKEYYQISDSINSENLSILNGMVSFNGRTILIVDKENKAEIQQWKAEVDYIIIRNNPYLKVEELYKQLSPQKLIFDSSNSAKTTRYWLAECEQNDLPCHFISNDGAFTLILND